MITIIDTEKLAVIERYDFLETDPTGIGTYRRVFSPMLQGDYFTFLGEKEEDLGSNMRRIGIFDYKARKLVWEYELISIDEYEQTRSHLVPSKPLYMIGNKLYIKDFKNTFCVLIKGLTNLKFFQNMPHSRATLYLIYIGQPSSSDV